MTIKIAHLADTHLGCKQYGLIARENDFYETFKRVIDDIISKDVDYVLHSGDLFEQSVPPIKALLVAQECFLKLIENNIEVFVIAGNHDLANKRDTSIPQKLYENEKFHILTFDENSIEVTPELNISGLPFIQKSYEEIVKKELYELADKVKDYKYKILMLHGGVSKVFDFNPEFELDTIPEGFDYYAMGHIHKRVIDRNFKGGILSFPGSTEMKDKGELIDYEKNKKGYTLLTLDDEISAEYVNVDIEREFLNRIIRYPKLDEGLEKLKNEIEELISNGNKEPVLLLTVKDGDFDRTDVHNRVDEKLENLCLTIKLNYEPTLTDTGTITIKEGTLNPEPLIKNRLADCFKELNGENIGEMGVEIYTAISKRNTEEAYEITENYYKKNYSSLEGEKDDN